MRGLWLVGVVAFQTFASSATLACAVLVAGGNAYWKDNALWSNSIRHSNDFFIKHGWDEANGSFVSELAIDGKKLSDARHLLSSARMVYGLAHGHKLDERYLPLALRQADFLWNKMTAQDAIGTYFLPQVNGQGVAAPQTELAVNYQAYGIGALVALYSVMKEKDPTLLAKIEALYRSFYARYHDSKNLGFFDAYDLAKGRVNTKSYNSTVYVATSFLMPLSYLETPNQNHYVKTALELADIVADHFYDPQTGWLLENFGPAWEEAWRPWQLVTEGDKKYTVSIVGHNFQAAWFLMRAAEYSSASAASKIKYLDIARKIITSMLNSKAINHEYGGVFDCFRRETGETIWHTNMAWWQQAEAILALTKAEAIHLFEDPIQRINALRIRDQILRAYFAYFIDYERGGEYPIVSREGQPILTENKGTAGTGTYHQVELAVFMRKYATAQTRNELADWNQATAEAFFKNYDLAANWPAFVKAQSQLLSPKLVTIVSDHRGIKEFVGIDGYFSSLKFWSDAFATGPDFKVEYVSVNKTEVVARLHGTLTFKRPIQGMNQLRDSGHRWTERITFGSDGSIERLEVHMNLFE